jgi:hypothetical protein
LGVQYNAALNLTKKHVSSLKALEKADSIGDLQFYAIANFYAIENYLKDEGYFHYE